MKIIFMGTPAFAVSTLTALVDSEEEVIGVVTQPDRPKGRKQILTPSPVKVAAEKLHLPVYQPLTVKDPLFIQTVRDLVPDLAVVVAFGQILPKALLDIPKYGCFNIHASLLPAYRGAGPIQWAIIEGETVTGVTVMQMDPGMDTGPMLYAASLSIDPEDTAVSLSQKLADLGAKAIIEAVKRLKKGELTPVVQDSTKATNAPLLKKEDGLVRWEESADRIERKSRALTLWPGMFTYREGALLKMIRVEVVKEPVKGIPGEVMTAENGKITVATGKGGVHLLEVQPENGKIMTAAQYLAGYPLKRGERLGPK
ncbi:MAG: methionyl-tRNA formyltransferase [Nitrospirae bacterium]|nr:methionyl-tRNA formyltransferase [Nitrospirota bacterium]